MYSVFEHLLQINEVSTYKVSKDTGIAQSVFSAWKTGVSTPKHDKLQIIANYFKVPVEYLMTGEEKEKEEDKYYLNEDTLELAQFAFENPKYKILFDASRKVKPEEIDLAIKILDKFSSDN